MMSQQPAIIGVVLNPIDIFVLKIRRMTSIYIGGSLLMKRALFLFGKMLLFYIYPEFFILESTL